MTITIATAFSEHNCCYGNQSSNDGLTAKGQLIIFNDIQNLWGVQITLSMISSFEADTGLSKGTSFL